MINTPQDNEQDSNDQIYNRIAADFATNMIDIATSGNEYDKAAKLLLNEELYERRSIYPGGKFAKKVRNILIVGSGASKNANKNIKTAMELVEGLLKVVDVSKSPEPMQQMIDTIAEYEKFVHRGSDTDSFEFKLKAIGSVMTEQKLREKLQEELGYKHIVSLFYEIIGHMFKHRLIDVIINMNFDEILDNIIDDEMGKGEYVKILLNGHCPDDPRTLDIHNKLATPLYIKPHGTITHAGSLKFINEHYFPKDKPIKRLIRHLLTEPTVTKSSVQDLPINIISVGYGFNDPDMRDVLFEAGKGHKGKFTFFIFDQKSRIEYFKDSYFIEKIREKLEIEDSEIRYVETSGENNLGQCFKEIWLKTADNFNPLLENKYPKGIYRHELTALIFHHPLNPFPIKYLTKTGSENYAKNKENFLQYLEDRILLELAIIIVKSDGIIHMNQLRESRINKYANQYFEVAKSSGRFRSLKDFTDKFKGLGIYMNAIADTFEVNAPLRKGKEIDIEEIINCLDDEDVLNPDVPRAKYIELLSGIARNKLCVVNPDIREYNISPFNGLKREDLLYSDTRWLFKFRSLFQETVQWNVLLCISEKGEILPDDYYKKELERRKALVWMIVADLRIDRENDPPEVIKAEDYPTIRPVIESMPWELHNKHMYIFINVNNKGQLSFVAGIYYSRRLLSNIVNPVMLNGNNVKTLFNFYCNYWAGAKSYKQSLENENAPYKIGRNEDFLTENIKNLRQDIIRKAMVHQSL